MPKSRFTFYDPKTFDIIVEAGQEITDDKAKRLREFGFYELAVRGQEAQEAFGMGRCKSAMASVRLNEGEGQVTINGQPAESFLGWMSWEVLLKPFEMLGLDAKSWTIDGTVKGSARGSRAQIRALQHAIAGALAKLFPEKRRILKLTSFRWQK